MSGPLGSQQWMYSAATAAFYTHQIANSCRFDSASSSYLYRSPSTASDGKKGTVSCWVKRGNLANFGESAGTPQAIIGSSSSEAYEFYDGAHDDKIKWSGGGGGDYITTGDVYRDTSAWYHLVFRYDSTQGTDSNRLKFYKNGELIAPGTYTEASYASSNEVTAIGNGDPTRIGRDGMTASTYFDGYLAEVIFTDGQSYAPSSFGETKNGVWIPKDPSGLTFGNNGFWLKFQNSSALGDDSSGNDNDFTASGLGTDHQTLDSPTFGSEGSANFATLGPLWNTPEMTFSEGNCKYTVSTNQRGCMSNWAIPIGTKFYWEYTQVSWGNTDGDDAYCGVNVPTVDFTAARGGEATSYSYGFHGGVKNILGTESSYGATIRTGAIVGVAIDRVNHTINFSKNGSFIGTFAISATKELLPWFGSGGGGNSAVGKVNFGADSTFSGQGSLTGTSAAAADENGYGDFYDAVPDGFLALCSANLATAAAIDPTETSDDYPQKLFAPKLYTGDGATTLAITGMDFQPDLTWIKNRDSTSGHKWFNSTIGVTKYIASDSNAVLVTAANTLKSWTSDGFTVGDESGVNTNTHKYASWNWRVNAGTTTTNDGGSVDSVVQTDPSAGFSIAKYTGTGSAMTVAHGLAVAPEATIIKDLDSTASWVVYTKSIDGSNDYFVLDTTVAKGDSGLSGAGATLWTWESGSGFSNVSGNDHIMYNIASKEGYSKVGIYEGNGASDGTFVYIGFSPAFVMTKSIDSTSPWHVFDNLREGYNVDNDALVAEDTTAESTTDLIDILSNGFKFRNSIDPNIAETYFYIAFAHNPFKYATAR